MGEQTISDIDTAIKLFHDHSWVPLALLIVGAFVRLMKDDRAVAWFRVEVAPRYRAWAALLLGVVLGVLHKLSLGGTWGEAIVGGFVAGGGSTWLHELVIESIRRGRDVGIPKPPEAPPPGPPPISIKPPANVVITEAKPPSTGAPISTGDRIAELVGVILAIAFVGICLFVGLSCSPASTTVAVQQAELAANGAECRRKLLGAIGKGGTCDMKRARLGELLKYDADCVGLYADAGPTFLCHDFHEGGAE